MSIEDRLGNKSEAWIAENAGDKLIGTIVAVTTLEGDYGPYPAVEIQDKEGVVRMWHAFDTVAKNELAKQSPAVGDEIGAQFLGKTLKKSATAGSTRNDDYFKNWHVIVEKATGPVDAPDWDAVGAEAQAEAADGIADLGTPVDDIDYEQF